MKSVSEKEVMCDVRPPGLCTTALEAEGDVAGQEKKEKEEEKEEKPEGQEKKDVGQLMEPSIGSCMVAEHGRSVHLPSANQNLEQLMATQFSNIGQKFDAILEHLVKSVPMTRVGKRTADETLSTGAEVATEDAESLKRTWQRTEIEDAAANGKPIAIHIRSWLTQYGYGFGEVADSSGVTDVFIHRLAVRGPMEGLVGRRMVALIIPDSEKKKGAYRAIQVWSESAFVEKTLKERAEVASSQAASAANKAAKIAVAAQHAMEHAMQAERLSAVLHHPPGLGQVAQPAVHTVQAPAQYHLSSGDAKSGTLFPRIAPVVKVVDVPKIVHQQAHAQEGREDIMGKWEVVHKNSSVAALFGRQSYEIKDDHGRLLVVYGTSQGVLYKVTLDKEDWLEAFFRVGFYKGSTIRLRMERCRNNHMVCRSRFRTKKS